MGVYGDVTALAANAGSEVQTAVPVNGINYGDTIRVGDEFRRVVDDTGRHYATGAPGKIFRLSSGFAVPKTRDTILGFATAVPAPIFKQNGMMYDITFESGCRTHADCRNNGIDENASDGPDPTPLVEGNDMGAVCHPGGACICSSTSYFGDGCPTDGRGSHAAPKKYVSGNIRNLECDKTGLTPSIPLRATATVVRTDPRKVILTASAEAAASGADTDNTLSGASALASSSIVTNDQFNGMDLIQTTNAAAATHQGHVSTIDDSVASDDSFTLTTGQLPVVTASSDKVKLTNAANALKVGDMIRIGDQVRTVTYVSPFCARSASSVCDSITSTDYVLVDADFVEDEFSSHDNIFDEKHTVERLESDSVQVAAIGSELATCTVTDMRQLTATKIACDKTDGPACGKVDITDGSPALNPVNRVITMDASSYLMDPREVDIGDRIRLVETPGAASTAEIWETRTIDSVTYSTESSTGRTGQVASFVTEYGYTAGVPDATAAYNDGSGTMEAKSCSGRGLCDESTGECACFSGYTDVDCSVQNSLAI